MLFVDFNGLGDRAVIIYDGRLRLSDCVVDAKTECVKRGYTTYQFFKGESFTRCKAVSSLYKLEG